jgi:hypothetical protein
VRNILPGDICLFRIGNGFRYAARVLEYPRTISPQTSQELWPGDGDSYTHLFRLEVPVELVNDHWRYDVYEGLIGRRHRNTVRQVELDELAATLTRGWLLAEHPNLFQPLPQDAVGNNAADVQDGDMDVDELEDHEGASSISSVSEDSTVPDTPPLGGDQPQIDNVAVGEEAENAREVQPMPAGGDQAMQGHGPGGNGAQAQPAAPNVDSDFPGGDVVDVTFAAFRQSLDVIFQDAHDEYQGQKRHERYYKAFMKNRFRAAHYGFIKEPAMLLRDTPNHYIVRDPERADFLVRLNANEAVLIEVKKGKNRYTAAQMSEDMAQLTGYLADGRRYGCKRSYYLNGNWFGHHNVVRFTTLHGLLVRCDNVGNNAPVVRTFDANLQ